MRRHTPVTLSCALLLSCGSSSSSPTPPPPPGSLDNTFGTAGVAVLDLGAEVSVSKMAVQADGKIVVAGRKGTAGTNADVLVARLGATGALDATFGTGGTRVVDLGSNSDFGSGLAVLANGKIVVGAVPGLCQAALVQLDSAGALDGSFAIGGVFNLAPGSGGVAMCAFALAVQPVDGKILLGGVIGGANGGDFSLARFTPAGALDAGFGTGGLVSTDFGQNDQIFALALQADGKIVAGGSSQAPSSPYTPTAVAVARYDPFAGALDATFATSGLFTQTLSATAGQEPVLDVLQLSDGKLLLLAGNGAATNGFSLLRLTAAGVPDATFGAGGRLDRDYGSQMIVADGKLYVVGTRYSGPAGTGALQRLSVDGVSDTTFGTSGEVTLSSGASTVLSAVARQPDGKIVVAGTTTTLGVTKLLLARYNP